MLPKASTPSREPTRNQDESPPARGVDGATGRPLLPALSAAEIAHHVEVEPSLDCAGGFKSEGLGLTLMNRMESTDPTGLIGLPLIWVASVLRPFVLPSPGSR